MATVRKTATKSPVPAKPRVAAKPQAAKPAAAKKASVAPMKAPATPQAAIPPTPKAEKKAKPEKLKVVRDSFTIPKSEYAAIAELKKRALALGSESKKSELLRAGLMLLSAASDSALRKALAQVPTLKTGRPGKN